MGAFIGLILVLGLVAFTIYQIVSLIKQVKLRHALKKDKQKENNGEVNKE